MPKPNNLVWVELTPPSSPQHAQEICAAANNMLARLRDQANDTPHGQFSWSTKHSRYEYGTPMGSELLNDNGKWFSLDYFGRPLEPAK